MNVNSQYVGEKLSVSKGSPPGMNIVTDSHDRFERKINPQTGLRLAFSFLFDLFRR